MFIKKNIFAFLFSLFAFLSISGFARIDAATHCNDNGIGVISESSNQNDNHNITSLQWILQTSIKVDESNHPTFKNVKNNKKSFFSNSKPLAFDFSKPCYTFYCINRINTISVSPRYILHRRLII